MAFISQISIKESEVNFQHGRLIYSLLDMYIKNSKSRLDNFLFVDVGTAKGFSSIVISKCACDNNINFKGQEKDIDMLMKDIQNNHKNLVKMMESPKLNLNVMDEYAKMYEDAVQKAREKQRLSDTHKREKEALAKKHARMKEQKELDEGMIDLDKARKLPDNIQKQILDLKKEYDRTWDGVFVPMGKEGSSQRKEYERRGKLFKAASKKYKDFLKKHKVATFK
mgnify:CR=1 FL=1